MPIDRNYSLRMPLGTESALNRRIMSIGLDSVENDILNTMNITLLGFGKVLLDERFRNKDTHSFCNELNIVFSGRGRLRYNGKDTIMTPGNAYFFPAGGTMEAHSNEPLVKYYFQFRAQLNGCEVFRDGRPLTARTPRTVIAALNEASISAPDILAARANVLRCLSLFSRALFPLITHQRDDLRRFEPFFRYVNEHLNGEFSLADFGAHHGHTPKNFAAQFKKQFGESPKKYFLREKTNRIKEALYHSDETLSGIGDRFGFSDQFYFSRFFKKMTGTTPSGYRTSVKAAWRTDAPQKAP